ncbi:MAG: GumC family protein [Pirellulales bacterium]
MYVSQRYNPTPADVLRILRKRWVMWLLPGLMGLTLAALFIIYFPNPWQASQSLVVRNESINTTPDGPGRFRQENELKSTQETVAEVARSQSVVTAALRQIGPSKKRGWQNWPDADDIADLQQDIQVSPPKGSEFGKSEIFYLKVKQKERERAVALATALCQHLEAKLSEVRGTKAEGLVEELAHNLELAETELLSITSKLKELEQKVGGRDLADLRMLDQNSTGDSDLRRNVTQVELELRTAMTDRQIGQELMTALESALKDPTKLVATPNRLLESQPALRQLKEGLLKAQLHTAEMLGSYTPSHPQVKTAQQAEQQVRQQLQNELSVAVRGLVVEQRLADSRIAMLEEHLDQNNGRLDGLADLRAEYSNLSAAAKHHNQLVEKARKDLAEARGTQAASQNGSLISRIDVPSTGPRPVGPRKILVLLAGLLGGVAFGCGLIFLNEPAPPVMSSGMTVTTLAAQRVSTIVTLGPGYTNERGLSLKQALWKIAHDGALTRDSW